MLKYPFQKLQKWWSMSVGHYSIAAEVCRDGRVIVECNVQSLDVRFWMPLLEVISSFQRGDETKGLKTHCLLMTHWRRGRTLWHNQTSSIVGSRGFGLATAVSVCELVHVIRLGDIQPGFGGVMLCCGCFQASHVTSASESGCFSSMLQ